jgi:DNA-directed RNA polymerase specialized sigma24 family protein
MEELSYKEIAEIMNTSQASVESLLFRARSTLKAELDYLKK